jgi:hypothetical protein
MGNKKKFRKQVKKMSRTLIEIGQVYEEVCRLADELAKNRTVVKGFSRKLK